MRQIFQNLTMHYPLNTTHSRKRGFTMIELLVAATILALLATIGLVSFRSANARARDGKRQADISQVRSALELYRSATLTSGYPVGTNFATMLGTVQAAGYISAPLPQDPRNTAPYQYSYNGTASQYCICAQLENGNGNSNSAPTGSTCPANVTGGTHFCVSNP